MSSLSLTSILYPAFNQATQSLRDAISRAEPPRSLGQGCSRPPYRAVFSLVAFPSAPIAIPTGDQGAPAIYALVPRLPPATESHLRRSRSKRVDVSRVLHTIFLLLPTTLVSLDHFGFQLPVASNW
jgi:hypothetical protein